jgi:DNA-binding CsgD family transcriptional regulator
MSIELLIKKKILEIDSVSNHLPGVVIIHNLKTMTIEYMSEQGLNFLEVTMKKLINLGSNYFYKFFNPEDAKDYTPKVIDLLERNIDGEVFTFFQQVRKNENAEWTWFLSASKVILREENVPILMITIAQSIDPIKNLTKKVDKLLQENSLLKEKLKAYSTLTKREKEIFVFIAQGKKNTEIATDLFISLNTVTTHRKTIKKKLNLKNNFDVHQIASVFDLI